MAPTNVSSSDITATMPSENAALLGNNPDRDYGTTLPAGDEAIPPKPLNKVSRSDLFWVLGALWSAGLLVVLPVFWR
jgi:hypothetical protein